MSDLGTMTPKTVMARLVRSINAFQDRELSRLGLALTAQQAAILTYVEVAGAKSIGEIAVRIGVNQSVATRLIDRVEDKGLVARSRHPEDRRSVRVSATQEGSRAVAVYLPRINMLKRRLFAGVAGADIETFWQVLTAIENNVTEVLEDDSGDSGDVDGEVAMKESKR